MGVMTGHKADSVRQPVRHWWYHCAVAFVAAAAVFAVSTLPLQLSGLVAFITVVAIGLIERIARRSFNTRPRRGLGSTLYFVVGALVFVGSLVLAATVAQRTDSDWWGWALGAIVFVTIAAGAWVPHRD